MLPELASIRAAVWHSQSCLDTNQDHHYSTLKKQALLYVLLAEAGAGAEARVEAGARAGAEAGGELAVARQS